MIEKQGLEENCVFQKTGEKKAGKFDDLLFKDYPLRLVYRLEALRYGRKEREEDIGKTTNKNTEEKKFF